MTILLCTAIGAGLTPYGRNITQITDTYTYAQLREDLTALQLRYPDTLRVGYAGTSREGRELYAAVAGKPGARYHILIHASIHAREHMGSLLVMMQLERLLQTGVPRECNIHVLPMINPDGVHISQTGTGDSLADAIYRADVAGEYAKPPKRDALRVWKANAAGVDLNRNFDAGWAEVDTRPAPSGENYRGPRPESEPETRALVAYTERFPFGATISYHATGSEIFYEFGSNSPVNEVSLSLAKAVNRETGYTLAPDMGTSFGGFKDWAIEKRSIPSLTIEIGKGETPLALDEYADIWRRNKNVPRAAARWLLKYS